MTKNVIGFVGFGNMARAIAKGVLGGEMASGCELCAFDPSVSAAEGFERVEFLQSSAQVCERSDYVFLCVKPQMMESAVGELSSAVREDTVFVSIMAGVSSEKIQKAAGRPMKIVRVMPNTPMLVGKGVTATARPEDVSEERYEFIKCVFGCAGWTFEIGADKFSEVIPVHSSSIAVIFKLAQLIAENAKAYGIDYDTALAMFAKTLDGASAMITDSGRDIVTLREMVCSKGGTTLAMLDKLDEYKFDEAVSESFKSCVVRALELGK